MPTVRYEIRNEFGLSDPELYRTADDGDPEALLEAVAMAGLVGVLRQLGDLAEFAAEIFHDLHEEVTATAARGHGLMLRIQQLEADFPSIEKAFLSQTNPCPMSYNEGTEWHANLRRDQNLVTQGDMPRFILDSYEECRGPPRIFMLDKFDVAGAGACLKRYSDPSFFKVELASFGKMEEEVREKKARKIKKKGSRWRNGHTTESFLSPLIRSNLQPVLSEKISAKVPMRHVKLKSRNLIDSDITNRRSSMGHLLQVHLPEQKVLSVNSSSYFPIMVKSIEQVGSVPEQHGTLTNTIVEYPMVKERTDSQSTTKNDSAYFPIYEKGNQGKKGIATFEPPPDERMVIESKAKRAVTVYHRDSDEADEHSPSILGVDQKKSFVGTQITTVYGFDGNRSADKNRMEAILDAHSSDDAEMGPSGLPELDQMYSLSNIVFSSEGCFHGYRSGDVGSDLENYMDALNTTGSENETDSECKEKSDQGILNMEDHRMAEIYKRKRELPAHFSEPFDVGKPTEKTLNNMLKNEVSLSSLENSGNLTDTHPPKEETYSSDVSVTPEICLNETHSRIAEEINTFSMIKESVLSVHLLTSETCNANGSEAMSADTATVALYSGSCVSESTSSGEHVGLQASDEAQSVTIQPTETFSGYTEGNHQVGQQLNGNVEELFKYAGNSEIFSDELLHVSDLEGSSLGEEEAPEDDQFMFGEEAGPEDDQLTLGEEEASEDDQFMNCADEVASVTLNSSERFLGSVEITHEVAQQLNAKEEVFKSADFSNINELLLLPDMGDPFSASKVPLEENHPANCPDEQISEISDGISMLDHLSLTEDCSNLDDAPRQFDGATLFTLEMISHMNGEQQQSIEQVTEALSVLSGVSNSVTTPSLPAIISSAIMKSDVLPVEMMEGNEKPENLAADVSTDDLRLSQGFGDNLDGNVPCIVHSSELLSEAYDAMESLEHAAKYSTISCDDLLPLSDVPVTVRAHTGGDAEELFSEDTGSAQADSIPKEVPTWCDKDSTALFTKEDTETCSGKMIPAANCCIAIETSPIVADPCELAAKVDNVVASFEDSTDDDLGHIKILKPNFLPCTLEEFSAAEEPQNSHEMDSTKILSLASANNAFPDGRQLPSTEPVCAVVTGGTNPVTDNLKFLYGPTASNLNKEEQIEKNMESYDSLDEYVVIEADDDNLGASSIYSPKTSAFDVKLQEDYLPGVAVLDWGNLETNEMYHKKNMTLMPQIDDQPMSSTDLGSESPIVDSFCSSDAKLLDGACQTVAFEHIVGTESSLFSLGNEDAVSREGNEPDLTSSHQEGNHLEAFNIPFERAFSDGQNITQSNSEHIDGQPLKMEPAILTTVEINKLDIPSSGTGLYEQQEAEPVPSECTSEISVDSTASTEISATVLPVVASSSAEVLETSPQDFLEPQVAEATSSLKLQGVEGTPSLPPLPPLEWRTGKLRFGSLGPVGDTAKLSRSTNPFMVSSPLARKHPHSSVKVGVEMVRPTTSPLWENELVSQRFLNPEQGRSDLPPNANEARHQHGMNPPNSSLLLSHAENERNIDGHDALALEDMITEHHQLLQGGVQSTEDKRPQLSQLLPSLELERSQHESISMVDLEPQLLQVESIEDKRPQLGQLLPSLELERSQHESISMGDLVAPVNPFLAVSSSEEWKQYGYGLYGGESLRHLNLSTPVSVTGPNMPPYGFLYPMGETPSMIYEFMVPPMGGERPNWKPRSIRDLPRNPLIEAVVAHDKSKMRKVSELDRPLTRPKADERDSMLEQIRKKSVNLKPANAPKLNMKGPPTNLKLAAILEKANAIRKAFVGSDEEEDDTESWNDS